jgi:hypothetical protein
MARVILPAPVPPGTLTGKSKKGKKQKRPDKKPMKKE